MLQRLAYLNTGTNGPLSTSAARAAREELQRELDEGRTGAHFERRKQLAGDLREAYAAVLGCDARDVALTTSTSEGLAQTIDGLELGAGERS